MHPTPFSDFSGYSFSYALIFQFVKSIWSRCWKVQIHCMHKHLYPTNLFLLHFILARHFSFTTPHVMDGWLRTTSNRRRIGFIVCVFSQFCHCPTLAHRIEQDFDAWMNNNDIYLCMMCAYTAPSNLWTRCVHRTYHIYYLYLLEFIFRRSIPVINSWNVWCEYV